MKGVVHKHDLEIYQTRLRFCFHKETMNKHCNDQSSDTDGCTWWPGRGDTYQKIEAAP